MKTARVTRRPGSPSLVSCGRTKQVAAGPLYFGALTGRRRRERRAQDSPSQARPSGRQICNTTWAICLGVRRYSDEMISPDLARSLRQRGYDAISCHDVGIGNQGIPDEDQLSYAAQQGRAILTHNIGDFTQLDRGWKSTGRRHAGILLSPRISDLGTLLRYVARHLDTCTPGVQEDTLLWLDTSPGP